MRGCKLLNIYTNITFSYKALSIIMSLIKLIVEGICVMSELFVNKQVYNLGNFNVLFCLVYSKSSPTKITKASKCWG